jgi:hypothetical protein
MILASPLRVRRGANSLTAVAQHARAGVEGRGEVRREAHVPSPQYEQAQDTSGGKAALCQRTCMHSSKYFMYVNTVISLMGTRFLVPSMRDVLPS